MKVKADRFFGLVLKNLIFVNKKIMVLQISSNSISDIELMIEVANRLGAKTKLLEESDNIIDDETDKIIKDHLERLKKGDTSHISKNAIDLQSLPHFWHDLFLKWKS